MNITSRLPHILRSSPLLFVALFATLVAFSGSTQVYAQSQTQADKCFNEYDGKQLTQQKYENQYKKSNCPSSKDGNCKAKSVGNGSNTYYNISCSKTAGQAPGGNDEDTSGDTSTGCGGVETAYIECDATGNGSIVNMLLAIVNFIAVGVGILTVGGIIWGGMVYASSNGDANRVKQAKTIIVNAIVGLILFFFMYAFINYLVPGGLFT